jgi:hypothetical protein
MRTVLLCSVAGVAGVVLWACATAVTPIDNTDLPETGPVKDSGKNPDSGCPQFNTETDPKHCGSCTNQCSALQVCGAGVCKAACDSPTTKCVTDAGGGCVDLTKDPGNCGGCNKRCSVADAGSLPTDNGNPDAGIPTPDGGFDAGIAPQPGMPTCASNACGVNCPPSTTLCTDNICYDTQNNHEHCGSCMTACAVDTEWCTAGHCCSTGKEYCNGTCADVTADKNNCGACGNVCPGQEVCSSGVCTSSQPCSVVATAWCKNKGWFVSPWPNQFPNPPGGAIVCTKAANSAGNDCDTCATYNQLVWKKTAKDVCSSPQQLAPGNVYGGHSPCLCQANDLACGSWQMNNCTPD